MHGKMRLLFSFGLVITMTCAAQKPDKKNDMDTSFLEDYDLIFNELDALLDSLTAPPRFYLVQYWCGQ